MPLHSSSFSAADRRKPILSAAAPVFERLGRVGAATKKIEGGGWLRGPSLTALRQQANALRRHAV